MLEIPEATETGRRNNWTAGWKICRRVTVQFFEI
jgi:hypothetical protein